MMRFASSMRSLLARFRRDSEGVAAVEFALIVPFLITLYLGSMEAAALFVVDKRINSVSATIGDLVGQWDPDDGAISNATMTTYMDASKGIMAPYSTTGIKVIVSLVKVATGTGATNILWSRANSGVTAKTENTSYTDLTATSEMNKVSRGGCVIAAEVSYSYTPLLGVIFKTAINYKHVNYFLPRFGKTEPITVEGKTLTSTACTT